MSPGLILLCIAAYFAFLLGIAWITSRKATSSSYFLGNKSSPWYIVAFGLIGDSLSGVTFISVPGAVGKSQFSYLQIVLGYAVGYLVIAKILLPLYYRLNLTSIYGYLRQRYGHTTQVTGACFFLLSRLLGAAARLFLTMSVLQTFMFDAWNVPFFVSVIIIIGLILAYTYRGGIKTLVWTDTFQSAFLVLGVVLSIGVIMNQLNLGPSEVWKIVSNGPLSQTFFWDWKAKDYFWKQFISGVFIAVVMTGLDQNSMQKNLSCRTLGESQKNLYSFGLVVVVVNAFFLGLGALLYHYATTQGITIPAKTDQLFPMLALQHLGPFAAVVFILGLTAATFSSADSVLTTLTTSFLLDVRGLDQNTDLDSPKSARQRHLTHIGFAVLLLLVILGFRSGNNNAVIDLVLKLATYTYGPLLGLFALGLITKQTYPDKLIPMACILSPALCFVLDRYSKEWLSGYQFGFELLILNGALTACLVLALRSLWPAKKISLRR